MMKTGWYWWISCSVIATLMLWMFISGRRRHDRALASRIPGPTPLPFIGNGFIFMVKPEETLKEITKLVIRYGDYIGFWLGSDFNVVVKNPADVKLLLTSNKLNHKGPAYDFMKTYIGPGILTGGPTWRNHRKIVTPCYGKRAVRSYAEVFNAEGRRLAEILGRRGNSHFDVYHDVVNTTTRCVCRTLMGLSDEDIHNIPRMEEVVSTTQIIYNHIFAKITKWWLQIPIIYWFLGEKKKEDSYITTIVEMSSGIVERRKLALAKDGMRNLKENDENIMNIVDRYILCGELTLQEIVLETFTLFTTSQEASAKIASGVLLFLAHLPVWQDKVYHEILEVLGPGDSYVYEDDLNKLHYLDMVYKEALRYLPIAAFIQRTVRDEIAIKNGEYVLSPGTTLTIPLHLLHRDPRLWEDPDEVDPERFSSENVKKRDPNAFVPFSLGPMDCLGRVYATNLIKTLVVWVLRRVVLEAEGKIRDLELHVAISVKFAKGYNLRVRPRTKNTSK